jgi:hypothetical protein
VREIVEERRDEPDGTTRGYRYPVIRMLRADGGDPVLVWHSYDERDHWLDRIEWLGDGSAVGLERGARDQESYTSPFQLVWWRPGDPEFTPLGPVVEAGSVRAFPRRDATSEVVLWAQIWQWPERRFGRPRPSPRLISQELVVVDAEGALRALPLPAALADLALYSNLVVGIDADGRLIMLGGKRWPSEIAEGLIHDRVEALDLDTGQVVQIYP